jgi:hypothetical protein
MKFPAFHHHKFQTQLFSLKPMTSSCHVRIVNEIDKRASQPASLLRRLWQLQGKISKGKRRHDAAAKCANLFRLICIQTNFLTPSTSHAITLISGTRDYGVTVGNCKFLKAKPDNMYAGKKICVIEKKIVCNKNEHRSALK